MSSKMGMSAELRLAFDNQIELCDELEQLADRLPELDPQRCLHVANAIGPLITEAHQLEETLLFPLLLARLAEGPALVESIKIDHLEDECFADEVADHLCLLGSGATGLQSEATGYMLRAFFEGVRRRIRHERALLGPSRH